MDATRRAELLTTIDRAAPVKASILTDGEKRAYAGRMLRRAISSSDLKYAAVSDKDHAQLSREIDGKDAVMEGGPNEGNTTGLGEKILKSSP